MGENLRQVAQIIKADVGLTIAWVEAPNDDWDNHTNHTGMFNFQAVRLARIARRALHRPRQPRDVSSSS
jgi:hypothetical protein